MAVKVEREYPSMVDIDLRSGDLMDTLVALAGLASEVTADLTPAEIAAAKSTLIFEALNKGRKLREFFK